MHRLSVKGEKWSAGRLAAALFAFALFRATPSPANEAQIDACLRSGRLAAHLQFLGSDSLRGRAPGTTGGNTAANYIAERLREFGLDPGGSDGSWFQPVPIHGGLPLPGTRLRIAFPKEGDRRGAELELRLGEDYLLGSIGAGTSIARPAPVVFVGYGIVAPEYDYDDYRLLDVRNAVVVYLDGEPASFDPSYFAGPEETPHALPDTKQRQALARGARGSILIRRTGSPEEWSQIQREYGFEHRTLAYDLSRQLNVVLHEAVADSLLRDSGRSFAEILEMDRAGTMRSFPLRIQASFRGKFRERDYTSPNVIGFLRGSDPIRREEWVLLSAHYDGLGVGLAVDGDSIYNGVVDNASGTAALLEIARALAAGRERLQRSVAFVFTTGEESGLLGATYYCDHPRVPLHRTVANLNVDGLAFLDRFEDVVPLTGERLDLKGLLDGVAGARGLTISPVPPVFSQREEFLRGDHYAFALAGVPAFMVQEGSAYRSLGSGEGLLRLMQWGSEIYHTPMDDLDQPLRLEAACQHVELLTALAEALAGVAVPPGWAPDSPHAGARLRTLAEER